MGYINREYNKPPKINKITPNKQVAQNYYNTTGWKKLRNAYLMQHPLCEMCLKEGKTSITEEIHHKIPILTGLTDSERTSLLLNANNLIALCKYHHHLIHKQMKKDA